MKGYRLFTPTAAECYVWGYVLLAMLFLSLCLSSLLFAAGSHVQPWVFPAACAVSVLCGHVWLAKTVKSARGAVVRYYVVLFLLLFVAISTSALIYDNSSDGNLYHQGAVIALLEGWNPFAGSDGIGVLWIRHYAKGVETMAATIASFTGRLESGKAVNILLAASTFFMALAFMRREFPAHSRAKVLWLALVTSMSPIVLRQLYVYYVDYAMYSLMLLTVLSLVQIYRQSGFAAWSVLAMAALMAPTVKFTVAFYEYWVLAVAVIWFFWAHRRRLSYQLALFSVLLMVVGMCGLGYHPYVTNTLGWGNPFYPLVGSSVDIMAINTPQLYEDGNRVINFVRSLFYTYDGTAVWIPGVTDSLNDYVIAFDRRIAGFGPFFVYILIGSVLLFACCRRRLPVEKVRPCLLLAVLLFFSCFIFEQAWWMRYVPFLWAVPLLLLLCTEYAAALTKGQKIFRNLLYGLMAATMAMAVGSAAIGAMSVTGRFGAICRSASPNSTVKVYVRSMDSFLYKLRENGVSYELLDTMECADTTLCRLPLLEDWVVFYLDKDTYSRIKRPDFLDVVTKNKGE